ncbi:hypothetical protein B296_00003605 [Ensete ventricosum]|uniref:Uncharacterized protein n=1 Tax=Ensete ventricosum TaxID=4639 RepID=A0A427BCE7_ENSVE|nr:hypothetical protein B296_00003605 [Ensete ventricosum]
MRSLACGLRGFYVRVGRWDTTVAACAWSLACDCCLCNQYPCAATTYVASAAHGYCLRSSRWKRLLPTCDCQLCSRRCCTFLLLYVHPKDDHHVAHRLPRALDPAMLGYGRPNLRQSERRRRRSRVESFLLHATPHRGALLQGRHLQRRAHPERAVPAAGETDRAPETGRGRRKTPPPQRLEPSGRRDAGCGARQGGEEEPEATAPAKEPNSVCFPVVVP